MAEWGQISKSFLDTLSDGLPHSREELHTLCGPSNPKQVTWHISYLRRHLRPVGQDIVSMTTPSGLHYQLVRSLASPYDGRK